MKKSFFSVPRTLPLHALTTFLIGVGCVWPLSLSLGLTAPLSLCLTACGAVTLLFALLDCMPRLRALAYPLLLLAHRRRRRSPCAGSFPPSGRR